MADMLSFEYMILSFKYLKDWTEPVRTNSQYNEAWNAREHLMSVVSSHKQWIVDDVLVQYIAKYKNMNPGSEDFYRSLAFISCEKLATDILNRLVNGGKNDFSVSKTHLGICWMCHCCERHSKPAGDKCRLYVWGKTAREKAEDLWNHTKARTTLKKAMKYFDGQYRIHIRTDFDGIFKWIYQ